jgi:polyisoprenoid-binding protein YceI
MRATIKFPLILSTLISVIPLTLQAADGTHCTYQLDAAQAKVAWTAYKTTEKVGVTAGFNSVQITAGKAAKTIPAALKGASAKIDGLSVESNNEVRNANLKQAFFGLLKNKADIKAAILSAQGDDKQGTAVMNLTLNGKTRKVPMSYTVTDAGLEASGTIDALDYNGSKALKALNELCYELHKGKDGVSKTWSDVALKVTAPIIKTCN